MSRITSRDTKPELAVRSMLHRLGLRFRIHRTDLPGSPDIVLPRYKTVVFVHGCFWHRHSRCRFAYSPKSRVKFWREKFERNIVRDHEAQKLLRAIGWRIIVVWECELRNPNRLANRLAQRFKPNSV